LEQLDYLWRYQEIEDMLDQYNKERKKMPLVEQLNKLKGDILEKQELALQFGQKVKEKDEAYKEIRGRYESLSREFYAGKQKLETEKAQDVSELSELRDKASALKDNLAAVKADLQKLKPDIDELDAELTKVREELMAMTQKYRELKEQYDQQIKEMGISVDELRQERQELKALIDKDLMEKYQKLRKHKHMAVALVSDGKCSGCNMSLPSAILTAVKEGKQIIECENCGRILYYKSELDS